MARETARSYCDAVAARTGTFIAINHESLPFTVAALMANHTRHRAPYRMRPGYVEEVCCMLRGEYESLQAPYAEGMRALQTIVEQSTSWKLTRPSRALPHRLRPSPRS